MKKIWSTIVLICSLLVFTYQHSLAVDDTVEAGDTESIAEETETATFSNPAQAEHAANLSAEASAALDDDVDNAKNNFETAETERGEAQEDLNSTRRGVVTTEKELVTAEDNLVTAESYQAAVESAYEALTTEEKRAAKERYDNAMSQAIEDVAAAELALEGAQKNLETAIGDRKEAKAAMDAAEAELAAAETALNEVMGELAGVSVEAISDMRASKMGWGQIAHALGVPPSAIGNRRGHTKKQGKNFEYGFVSEPTEVITDDLPAPEDEIAEATKRDIQHGWNKGHGMTTSVSSSGKKGLGLSETDLGVGSKGSKASRGNSGSKSSKSSKSISTGSSKSNSKSSSASSSTGSSKSDRSSAGGPSNDKGNSGNASSGSSKSDRSSTGGPSDKSNNGNNGNDKSNSSDKANDKSNNGKSGKSK